ncbi:hypothetical protein BOTBODRAFT_27834, partial [Botryobasidium botryosum FD-172 SS1]
MDERCKQGVYEQVGGEWPWVEYANTNMCEGFFPKNMQKDGKNREKVHLIFSQGVGGSSMLPDWRCAGEVTPINGVRAAMVARTRWYV